MKFRFLPDIATADLAFEAYGADYNELFENAGLALESAQINISDISPSTVKELKLTGESPEDLLLSFLEELVFLKDAENLLFNSIVCKLTEEDEGYLLEVKLAGEKIDRNKHKLGVDVKAVTKHIYKLEKLPDRTLRCQVVLDV